MQKGIIIGQPLNVNNFSFLSFLCFFLRTRRRRHTTRHDAMMRVEKIHDEQRMRMRMMNGKRARKEYCLYSRKMRRRRNRINFTIYRISSTRPRAIRHRTYAAHFSLPNYFSPIHSSSMFFSHLNDVIFFFSSASCRCVASLWFLLLFASFPFHITQVSKATCYMLSSEKNVYSAFVASALGRHRRAEGILNYHTFSCFLFTYSLI